MEMLLAGFLAILNVKMLFLILLGVVVGIIFGSIPGLSATMAVALFLPLTFGMTPIQGMSILIGLYIGGVSGGLISAILLKIPGTPSSISTTFDGSPMAEKGEAGKALGVGIVFSFIGGTISIIALMFIAPILAKVALKFGPIEYFAVGVFSLTLIANLSKGSIYRGLLSGCLGMSIALIGSSPIDGLPRFNFGFSSMIGGFQLIPVMIGMFAVPEILNAAQKGMHSKYGSVKQEFKIKGFGFSIKEFVQQIPNSIRSSVIGTAIGILPGIGGGTSNIIAYTVAKNASKYPEKFGTGVVDGIVASESANNASVGGALIPLLTLGIPGDAVTAILLGGLMIHGMTPGPLLFKTDGAFMYALFAALIIANMMMLIVEYFGMKGFVRILSIDKGVLFPVIFSLCAVGAFAINNRSFDVFSLLFFGILGYVLEKFKFPIIPVILGFILGPMVELNLRRGLMFTDGNFLTFFTHPIAAVFMLITIISIAITVKNEIKESRKKVV